MGIASTGRAQASGRLVVPFYVTKQKKKRRSASESGETKLP